MSKSVSVDERGQLQLAPIVQSLSIRFDPGMYLLNRSVQQNHPLLAQLVTWRNSVDLFREQERRDFRELYNNSDHRAVLSALIGQGEYFLHLARLQDLSLEAIGLRQEMIESEIRALRDDLRITHEELISDQEAEKILGVFGDA